MAESIGDRIKQACKAAGVTQKELATRTGIEQRTLTDLISGRNQEKLERAAAIAEALGVSLGWLITGKGDQRAVDLPVRSMRQPAADVQAGQVIHFPRGFSETPTPAALLAVDEKLIVTLLTLIERRSKNASPERKGLALALAYDMLRRLAQSGDVDQDSVGNVVELALRRVT